MTLLHFNVKLHYIDVHFLAVLTLQSLFLFIIIESCTERKQNIVDIMVQRSAPSNK